jgi:hypothetical protein
MKKKDQRWKNGNNEMTERQPDVGRKEDTKGMLRKEPVAICRLRTEYTRATHGPKMQRLAKPIYPSTTYCGNAKKLRTREPTWT